MTTNTDTLSLEKKTLKPTLGLILIFVLFAFLNIPILKTIWENSFDDGTYSHAYLIPVISIYLYYNLAKIGQLRYREQVSVLPIMLIFASAALLFVMSSAQISLGYWAATLAILLSSIMLIYRTNWQLIFPTLFLAFLMPGWGLLTATLQNVSTRAVTFLMSYSGIPTFVEGNFVTIPAGVFEIAGGCSGLRYLIVSLAISSLFSFLYIKNTKKAVLFFTVAILGALITNWIRITALILIGEYTDMQSDLMTDHNVFGWYLYIPFMLLLFMWGNKLADHDLLSDTPINAASPSSAYPTRVNTLILFVAIIISSTALKSLFLNDLSSSTEISEIKPIIKRYTTVEQISSNTANTPDIYLKYFFNGTLGNGKPTAHDNIYIPLDWYAINQEAIGSWMYVTISNKQKTALIRYSFEINNQQIASSGSFKKLRILEALKGNSETYLYWQYTDCSNRCDQKKELLQQFN
jgi:exosortase A